MSNKLFILLAVLLLPLATQAATYPIFHVNISTLNGSVTISDSIGENSETFGCLSKPDGLPQKFRFQGKTAYDVTVTDCKEQLTNLTCNVQNVACNVPQSFLDTINANMGVTKTELINNLPQLVVDKAQFKTIDNLTIALSAATIELGTVKAERDVLLASNRFYLILASLAIITLVLLILDDTYDLRNKIFGKKIV